VLQPAFALESASVSPAMFPSVTLKKTASQVEAMFVERKVHYSPLFLHKHSSLLRKFVNYGQKSFITLAPVQSYICQ